MKRTKLILITLLITAAVCFGKNYYIKQRLIAPSMSGSGIDTIFQETYVSDDLIIVQDEFSKQFTDNDSYTYFNLTDSTFFKKNFSEIGEISNYANSQIEEFSLTPVEEEKKIGSWKTKLYKASAKVMGMEMLIDMYISKDTGVPADVLFRQQEKIHSGALNIKNMIDKIKETKGIVVKEIAKIGGQVVSEKEITAAVIIDRIKEDVKKRPEGFTEMKK